MQIKTVTRKNGFFKVLTEDGRITTVPDDLDNTDRKEVQEWLDAGNELEEEVPPATQPEYNWNGLAIAFKLSQLNQLLSHLKDEGTNPQINAIWRISDELVQVITIPVFEPGIRVAGMTRDIVDLFQRLQEGEVPVSTEVKQEIAQALKDNGFTAVAQALSQSTGI